LKKIRRRNWIIAIIAVVIMLAGGSLVGGTYVFASIKAPEEIALPGESTTIYYADGKTEMAKIGDENRTIVPLDKIPAHVLHAVIAVEDRTFYSNEGVDFKGIVRAAWNNVTGGEQQGASTITQQYARKVAELEGGYTRKIKEAAIAMKLADQLSKDEILRRYINTVYFGRGAYGVEAAARAYFLKDHATDLTVEEGIFLAGLIKNPDAGKGSPFDPNVDPVQAKARWEAGRDALIAVKPALKDHGSDSYQVTREMQMPAVPKVDPTNEKFKQQYGLDKPTGIIVHHVMDELSQLQKTDRNLSKVPNLKNGGLRIVTSIDGATQAAAQKYGDRDSKASPLNDDPDNLVAAIVAVEPYTGRVIAYYGGPKGDGTDYAGSYADPVLDKGDRKFSGFHPPASSFKIYALATALRTGISIESYWDATAEAGKKLRPGNPVRNANPEGNCSDCLLWEATEKSLNIPFYALTKEVTAAKVLETARAAGIRFMRDDSLKVHDLNSARAGDLAPEYFNTEIGIGQYGITVLDHATGVASLAAKGNAAKAHFVREVYKGDDRIYAEQLKLTRIPDFTDQMSADMDWTLQKVAARNNWNLPGGRNVAGKTGTWENGDPKQRGQNSHSWTVGYTAAKRDGKNASQNYNGLAAAVWVGNKDKDSIPIKDKNGKAIIGATGAGPIFKKFMEEASKGKPVGKFGEPRFVGDPDVGTGKSPQPSAPPNDQGNGGPGNGGPGGGNGGPGGGGNGGGRGGGGIPVPGIPPPPTRD
jgi:membrane peptidoglycan carboxypeptidase